MSSFGRMPRGSARLETMTRGTPYQRLTRPGYGSARQLAYFARTRRITVDPGQFFRSFWEPRPTSLGFNSPEQTAPLPLNLPVKLIQLPR